MTIKTKLIANILVTAAIIIGMSIAFFSSMRFLQEKISYLTEKSTPFQTQTLELQRELHACSATLAKVNTSRTMGDYMVFRVEAEKYIANIEQINKQLSAMTKSSSNVSNELNGIALEFFDAIEERILSNDAATQANAAITGQMKESSTRLAELESRIRILQVTHADSFARSLEHTNRLSVRLRNLEELRDLINELGSVSVAVQNAQNSSAFRIAQGKVRTVLGRISHSNVGTLISSDLKALAVDMNEFLLLRSEAISQKSTTAQKWSLESKKELSESMNRLILTLDQEIELASSQLAIETHRQGTIFARSNSTNGILVANSKLNALSLTVTGEINRLFTIGSPAELQTTDAKIRSLFTAVFDNAGQVERALAGLDAGDELRLLRAAGASLAAIRTQLYAPDGIIATLATKLKAVEQTNVSTEKLNTMIIKQSRLGNENVSIARRDQETSIVAVNGMVGRSLSRIITSASLAIVISGFFGFWIYRSVFAPLRIILAAVGRQRELVNEKAHLAEAIAGGDLDRDVVISEALSLDSARMNHDEMGMVLNAVIAMSDAQVTLDRALAKMTASLRGSRDEEARRDRLKSGLYELNAILRIGQSSAQLADRALAFIASFLSAGVGIIYLYDDHEETLHALSSYAISASTRLCSGFRLGEGLAGQAALERKMICLSTLPPNYLPISSALGETTPRNIVIAPIMHHDTLVGILELGSLNQFRDDDVTFLNQALEGIAIAIGVSRSHQLVSDLLEQTQAQAEELRVQQEELQQTNEELIERAHMLAEQRKQI